MKYINGLLISICLFSLGCRSLSPSQQKHVTLTIRVMAFDEMHLWDVEEEVHRGEEEIVCDILSPDTYADKQLRIACLGEASPWEQGVSVAITVDVAKLQIRCADQILAGWNYYETIASSTNHINNEDLRKEHDERLQDIRNMAETLAKFIPIVLKDVIEYRILD